MAKEHDPSNDKRPIAVLGLGRFGQRIATQLAKSGQAVIACDLDRDAVERIASDVAQAIVVDVTDEEALKARGVHKVKAAVVAIGDDFEAAVLATVTLKQLDIPRIIARGRSDTTARVLRRVGASDVVLAEIEAADRWAGRLLGPGVLNQIEFHEGYSIIELRVPKPWVGKSLADIGARKEHHVHVIAVKREDDLVGGGMQVLVISPDEPLKKTDVLMVMGQDDCLRSLSSLG